MRKAALTAILLILACTAAPAGGPPSKAALDLGRTLRADYIFSGTDRSAEISLSELCQSEGWAGRRVNMDVLPLRGNGQIVMRVQDRDGEYSRIVYASSFSSLFQEWQATQEATRVRRSFENTFLLPMPLCSAEITVTLLDIHGGIVCSFSHVVDPADILIRPCGQNPPPHEWIWKGGGLSEPDNDNLIDIAIVAEGYTEEELDVFIQDARSAMESLWAHEPFGSMKDRFNIVAVKLPSRQSGVSVPREGLWKDTAAGSHFDTFYSDRYLTTLHIFKLHDALSGIPYEHIIILANTDTYGGGGIYNSYTLTTAHHQGFLPVVVHEFGHSFAGLADEYYYDDQYSDFYTPDNEPWEQNITTCKDFASKWKDMVGKEYPLGCKDFSWKGMQPVPDKVKVGCLEGGGYMSKGVWRGADDCRMKTNSYPAFCPVCQRAIGRIIRFYTEALDQ